MPGILSATVGLIETRAMHFAPAVCHVCVHVHATCQGVCGCVCAMCRVCVKPQIGAAPHLKQITSLSCQNQTVALRLLKKAKISTGCYSATQLQPPQRLCGVWGGQG